MKQKTTKKQLKLLKKFENDDVNNEEIKKEEIKKPKITLQESINSILLAPIDKQLKSNPIFAQYKKPIKKLKKEKEQKKNKKTEKLSKISKENLGRVIPNADKDFKLEFSLKEIAIKGVVHLLNKIKEFQKQNVPES